MKDLRASNVRAVMFVLVICSDLPRNVGGFSFTSKTPEKRKAVTKSYNTPNPDIRRKPVTSNAIPGGHPDTPAACLFLYIDTFGIDPDAIKGRLISGDPRPVAVRLIFFLRDGDGHVDFLAYGIASQRNIEGDEFGDFLNDGLHDGIRTMNLPQKNNT